MRKHVERDLKIRNSALQAEVWRMRKEMDKMRDSQRAIVRPALLNTSSNLSVDKKSYPNNKTLLFICIVFVCLVSLSYCFHILLSNR